MEEGLIVAVSSALRSDGFGVYLIEPGIGAAGEKAVELSTYERTGTP